MKNRDAAHDKDDGYGDDEKIKNRNDMDVDNEDEGQR